VQSYIDGVVRTLARYYVKVHKPAIIIIWRRFSSYIAVPFTASFYIDTDNSDIRIYGENK